MWIMRYYDYSCISAVLRISERQDKPRTKKTISRSGKYLFTRYTTLITLHCDGHRYSIFIEHTGSQNE